MNTQQVRESFRRLGFTEHLVKRFAYAWLTAHDFIKDLVEDQLRKDIAELEEPR